MFRVGEKIVCFEEFYSSVPAISHLTKGKTYTVCNSYGYVVSFIDDSGRLGDYWITNEEGKQRFKRIVDLRKMKLKKICLE